MIPVELSVVQIIDDVAVRIDQVSVLVRIVIGEVRVIVVAAVAGCRRPKPVILFVEKGIGIFVEILIVGVFRHNVSVGIIAIGNARGIFEIVGVFGLFVFVFRRVDQIDIRLRAFAQLNAEIDLRIGIGADGGRRADEAVRVFRRSLQGIDDEEGLRRVRAEYFVPPGGCSQSVGIVGQHGVEPGAVPVIFRVIFIDKTRIGAQIAFGRFGVRIRMLVFAAEFLAADID